MLTTEQAIEKVIQIITIGLRHADYDRTVTVAEQAKMIMTGKGAVYDDQVTRYRKRESKEEKAQRLRLHNSLTPYAASRVTLYYDKVPRIRGIHADIVGKNDDAVKLVQDKLSEFYNKSDFESYLFNRFKYFNFHDPNAFVVIEFQSSVNEEGKIDDIRVYPYEVTSERAVYYERNRMNELQYLVVQHLRTDIVVKRGQSETITREDYYLYHAGYTLHFLELGKDDPAPDGYEKRILKSKGQTKYYAFRVFETGTEQLPVISFGVYEDAETDNRTYVTPLEPALPVFQDLIKHKSGLDVTEIAHIFAQKYVYAPMCDYRHPETHQSCTSGYLGGITDNDHICPACKGKGVKIHLTEQDVIVLEMPASKEEVVASLADMAKYVEMPEKVLDYLPIAVQEDIQRIVLSVFPSDANTKEKAAKNVTATEKVIDFDAVQDRIRPYTDKISFSYIKGVAIAADYLEVSEVKGEHAFPSQYTFKGLQEMIADYDAAKAAGVSSDILENMEWAIISEQYKNNPMAADLVWAFRRHIPFRSKSTEEIIVILSERSEEDPDRLLYENSDKVFELIRSNQGGKFRHDGVRRSKKSDSNGFGANQTRNHLPERRNTSERPNTWQLKH